MIQSLYSGATGMAAQQLNLNTIANNLANANTNGFKRSKIEFQDLLYQKPRAAGADAGAGNFVPTGVEVGNGSRVAATSKVFTQGQLTATGEKLDIAIQGDGFFEVQRPDGTIFQGSNSLGKFGVKKFADNNQLIPVAGGFFVQAPGSPPPESVDQPELLQGYLEGSNVTPLREMVDLVLISRAYEANQKIITTVDQQMQKTFDALG